MQSYVRNTTKADEGQIMYDSKTLREAIEDYIYHCGNNPPTRAGLADWLSISATTVSNVVNGSFNGLPYTDKPHIRRIIANSDFGLIRSLFVKSCE